MKKISILIFPILLVGIGLFVFAKPLEEDIVTFDFAYVSPKGFNVTSCTLYYPKDVFLQKINAPTGSKSLITKSKPFKMYNSTYLHLNCTNINEENPLDIIYEYEKVQYLRLDIP